MARSTLGVCLGACVWAALLGSALAQSTPQPAIQPTVAALYQSAALLNPELQAFQARLQAQQQRIQAASALTRQPLALESAYRSDRNGSNLGARELEWGVSAPLWHWGERDQTGAVRQAELAQLQSQLLNLQLALAGEVRQASWDTLNAQVDVELGQSRVEAAQKLQADVKRRVDAGDLPPASLLQAQALVAQTQTELQRAQVQLAQVAQLFTSLSGLPASVLQGLLPEDLPRADAATHPQVKLSLDRVQTTQAQANLAALQKRANPELGLALVSDRPAFGSGSERSALVTVRLPLGNSAEYQSRVLESEANLQQAQVAVQSTQRTVQARLAAATSSLNTFEQLRQTAEQQAELTLAVLKAFQRAFDLGEADLPTLLRLEQQAFEAQRLARKAHIEYAARRSAYLQALGQLPQ